MDLKAKLHKIRKDSQSVNQYLSQIKEITYQFAAIGEPISYRDHLGHILDDLRVEYNAFVTSIQNQSDTPTLEDIRSLLLRYEARLEKRTLVDQLNLAQAHITSLSIQQNNKKSQPKFPPNFPQFRSFPQTSHNPLVNTTPCVLGKP